MATELKSYDSAKYLNSLEDIAYYLEAALEEAGDDPAFITQAIGVIAAPKISASSPARSA